MIVTARTAARRTPIRCLVIQMARLGDTIQSLMALKAAKELYPELQIHFLVRENFAHAARRVSWIEEVHTFPSETILAPVLNGEKTELQGLKDIARWIAPLTKSCWDLVVNWTFSESSSFLTGLLPAKMKLGFSRQKDTSFTSLDGWSHYIQGIVQAQVPQNIHLTDILTTQLLTALQIQFAPPVDPGSAQVTSKEFFSLDAESSSPDWLNRDRSRKWIAIQLGAASSVKTWPCEKWARLAVQIFHRHPECRFVLLGGKEDTARANQFLEYWAATTQGNDEVVNLVGKTTFDTWAEVIGDCQWLFSADTAAIHLASVLNTRVLDVSVGPVRWAETGPYGNGHYVLAPTQPCDACTKGNGAKHSCQEALSPEAAYGAWSYGSSEWAHRRQVTLKEHFTSLGYSSTLNHCQVLRSRIRDTAEGGGVFFEPLTSRVLTVHDWCARVTDYIGRAWYCGWTPPIGTELRRDMISPPLVQELRSLTDAASALRKICEQGTVTAREIHEHSANLKSDRLMSLDQRTRLHLLSSKLHELDVLMAKTTATHPALKAFQNMFAVLMHNLPGKSLSEIGWEASLCYRQLTDGAVLLEEWIRHTLALVRPVAVVPIREKERTPETPQTENAPDRPPHG